MSLTTHVLDTATGRPRVGVPVELSVLTRPEPGEEDLLLPWVRLTEVLTDLDGRAALIIADESDPIDDGIYRLRFELALEASTTRVFYPWIDLVVSTPSTPRLHVPLLLSPYGYTTYRGS